MTTSIYIYTKILVLFIKSRYINPHFPLKLYFVQLRISPSGDVSNDLSIVRTTFELLLERHLMSMQPPNPHWDPNSPTKNEAFPTTVRGSNVGFWLEIWGLNLFSEADPNFFNETWNQTITAMTIITTGLFLETPFFPVWGESCWSKKTQGLVVPDEGMDHTMTEGQLFFPVDFFQNVTVKYTQVMSEGHVPQFYANESHQPSTEAGK